MSMNRMMKVFIVFALVLALGIPAVAATTGSASLKISGTVDKSVSVTSDTETYSSLPIIAGGSVKVATITTVSNDLSGYTMTIKGKGYLTAATSTNATTVPYAVTFGTSSVTLGSVVTYSGTGGSYDVYVNVTASPSVSADTYSDTLTFDIAAL
jgi:hypothetical protein